MTRLCAALIASILALYAATLFLDVAREMAVMEACP